MGGVCVQTQGGGLAPAHIGGGGGGLPSLSPSTPFPCPSTFSYQQSYLNLPLLGGPPPEEWVGHLPGAGLGGPGHHLTHPPGLPLLLQAGYSLLQGNQGQDRLMLNGLYCKCSCQFCCPKQEVACQSGP